MQAAAQCLAAFIMWSRETCASMEPPQQLAVVPERKLEISDVVIPIAILMAYAGGFAVILALLAGY